MRRHQRNPYAFPVWFWIFMAFASAAIIMIAVAGTTGWDPLQLLGR